MNSDVPTTIEPKRYSPPATDAILARALKGRRGRLTKADAVTATGLPAHLVEDSLERLLARYRSHLEVTEDGELLYSFDPTLVRRDVPTLRERLVTIAHALARVGMWVFKGLITVTLVAYVVIFLILMLAMIFGGRGGDRRDDDGDHGFGVGFLWWFLLPDWHRGHHPYRDPWGRPVSAARRGRSKKKFIQAVFDFVFGPATPARDKLADEREILAYLREHDGRVTATDLVALLGWSYRQAEEEVTRLLIDYDGEPEVTEEGVLVYSFPKLLRSAEGVEGRLALPARGERPRPCWERLEERPPLTGNRSGMDALIGAFAGFNLLASFFAAGWARARFGLAGPGWDLALTGFPLAFFATFLAIPALRALARRVGDRARARRNARRRLIERVLVTDGGPLPAAEVARGDVLALEGEPDLDARGAAVVRFPRVAEERAALERHLAAVDADAERRVGPVIFGSLDDSPDGDGRPPLPPRRPN